MGIFCRYIIKHFMLISLQDATSCNKIIIALQFSSMQDETESQIVSRDNLMIMLEVLTL